MNLDEYFEIKPCVVDGEPETQYNVWFKVGVQSFCITPFAGNLEESAFMKDMFRTALKNMISELCPKCVQRPL